MKCKAEVFSPIGEFDKASSLMLLPLLDVRAESCSLWSELYAWLNVGRALSPCITGTQVY